MPRPIVAGGQVEVIAGPMFAGKTEELLRRVRRAAIAGQRVVVFSHALDTRAGGDRIASHAGLGAPSRVVGSAEEIVSAVGADEYDIVAIDDVRRIEVDVAEDQVGHFHGQLVDTRQQLGRQFDHVWVDRTVDHALCRTCSHRNTICPVADVTGNIEER